ncbi:hypothetical protein [Candidatus Palauibacter sp.]|uniref:hypothetical protein n=1 Tax=Candidatus Palauibacter sp. TaxID=3101350 RepID=UPI003CC662DB
MKGMPSHLVWAAGRIATAVALVVVPFGYAITGVHQDVWMGVGCGLAIGLGVGLRGGAKGGPWTGILIGAMVGIATALIAGLIPGNGVGIIVPPVLALAVGLIDGLRGSSLSRYRDVSRETFIVSVLLAVGLLPLVDAPADLRFTLAPLACMPWIALIAGLLSHRREGWRDARPPLLLVLSAAATFALLLFLMVSEWMALGRIELGREVPGALVLRFVSLNILRVVGVTAAAFLLGRAALTWLQPRLRVYGNLTDYLREMWVPIGGFAVGYLTVIVLFAGFYGMLERFSPGAFADAGAGITDWLSFSFFTALAQDYATVTPASGGARALVGVHLILSAGWVVVLFAAVMTSIGPKLDRIARRHAEEES